MRVALGVLVLVTQACLPPKELAGAADSGGDAFTDASSETGGDAPGPSVRCGFALEMTELQSFALDRNGDLHIAGAFWTGALLGDGKEDTGAQKRAFLAKFDGKTCLRKWIHKYGTGEDNPAPRISVDSAGNVVLAGTARTEIDLGAGPVAAGGYLAKFSPDGKGLWSKSFPRVGFAEIRATESEEVVAIGTYMGALDLGDGPLPTAPESAGWSFVLKVDASGKTVWSRFREGYPTALAVSRSGRIAIAGPSLEVLTPSASSLWKQPLGGPSGGVSPYGLAFGITDDLVLVGEMNGAFDYGGGPISADRADIMVAKFTATGAHAWSKAVGDHVTSSDDRATSVFIDSSDNVFVAGIFFRVVDFGSGPVLAKGTPDLFVAKYSAAGTSTWVRPFATTAASLARAAAGVGATSAGDVFVAATFRYGTVTLDDGARYSTEATAGFVTTVRR